MTKDELQLFGEQQFELMKLRMAHSQILGVFADVLDGTCDPSRVMIDLTNGTCVWSGPDEPKPVMPATINGLPKCVIGLNSKPAIGVPVVDIIELLGNQEFKERSPEQAQKLAELVAEALGNAAG